MHANRVRGGRPADSARFFRKGFQEGVLRRRTSGVYKTREFRAVCVHVEGGGGRGGARKEEGGINN